MTQNYPTPKLGRFVYLPDTERTTGGFAEIKSIRHEDGVPFVTTKEVPQTDFNWHELCDKQVEYVGLFAGGKVLLKLRRSA